MCTRHALALIVVAAVVPTLRADVILDWNEVLLGAIRADRTAPPKAARAMAMVSLAMFDAVNALEGSYEPYLDLSGIDVPCCASAEAAAGAVAHRVLVELYPEQADAFDTALANTLDALADGAAKDQGVTLGHALGEALLALRADDGADAIVEYTGNDDPGDWIPTPPGFVENPLLPQWPNVTPFCVVDSALLRRNGPPPLDSVEYAVAFNEVKELGAVDGAKRTEDQTEIAYFWADGPGTATPPGHWYQIARDVALAQGNSLEENARLFALMGMALCDAGICAWDNKYAYNLWRPVTAIQMADTDGNPDTEADPDWMPLIVTPPFPSYTSGHSTFSAAAAKVMAMFYSTDTLAFGTASDDVPGVVRSYASFSEAADEAGRSRIYGGIHFEFDNQDALSTGRELGQLVCDEFLRAKDPNVLEIPADSVARCGPIGLFPFGLLVPMLTALRTFPLRRAKRTANTGLD